MLGWGAQVSKKLSPLPHFWRWQETDKEPWVLQGWLACEVTRGDAAIQVGAVCVHRYFRR